MNSILEQELKEFGMAQVIVILKKTKTAVGLAAHFSLGETTQASAMKLAIAHKTRGRRTPRPKPVKLFKHLGVMLGTVNESGLKALLKDRGNVAEIRSAPVFRLIRPKATGAAPASPQRKITWGIEHIEAHKAWDLGITGDGVLVGHLDTGCDGTHRTLKGAIAHWAFFDDFGNIDPGFPNPIDTDQHGTHTAATIAGRPVKIGNTVHHVGVAPGAMLATAAVIEGGDSVARILSGIDWAIGRGVKVLSMSLGIPGFTSDFEFLTRALRENNILPAFAVGNEGPGTSRSPGNYAEALSVGAMDSTDRVADFSSSRRFPRADDPLVPDLVAPGVEVISAVPGNQFMSMDGSSMATPHVAGIAALLWQAKPDATVDEIEAAIYASCQRPATMPEDRANRGVPNVLRALEALT